MTRKATNQLLQMIDDGLLTALQVAEAALQYMSEREVADMAQANEFFLNEDDEAEEEAYFDYKLISSSYDPFNIQESIIYP